MSIGAILIGIAGALVVGAYLARPFYTADLDPERAIEAWVAQARGDREAEEQRSKVAEGRGSRGASEPVNFCSRCGRSVGPDDHFCPGCGAQLPRGTR